MMAGSSRPRLRPVEVVAPTEPATKPDPQLRLVTPAGYRIEGLAIDDVLAIVRVLG